MHAGLGEAGVGGPDRGEDRHPVSARPQAERGLDRDLGLTAIDGGMVDDEDDVQRAAPGGVFTTDPATRRIEAP
jgi:hypothetical protein